MVKSLTHCARCLFLLLAVGVVLLAGAMVWLHGSERSLNWAKPWIVSRLNSEDTPYQVDIAEVSIDWRNLTELGHIRIGKVALSKRGGALFAVLPQIEVTIDPIGFLPGRHLLNSVWLKGPKIFLTRDAAGITQLGLEGATGTMPIGDLFRTATAEPKEETTKTAPEPMPFRVFNITNASLRFNDVTSGTALVSESFGMELVHGHNGYRARLAFPFRYEDAQARLDARLSTVRGSTDQLLQIQLTRAPARLLCVFGLCPDKVEGDGPVSGMIGISLLPDATPTAVQVHLETEHAVLNAPELFEKPLALGPSTLTASSTAASHTITLTQAHLKLEDTTIDASGTLHNQDEVGWTVELQAKTSPLEVTKVRKYWPLPMAPESRLWVTSKMKSGRAESGTLKLHLKPGDLSAAALPDTAVEADVDARAIGFEFLPGFPEITAMDGQVHFTGRTIKILGSNGSMLTGTKINKATLWMPDLLNPRNPTETQVSVTAPAADVATLLGVKHFDFDDAAMLDAGSIKGDTSADLALKFDSFSEKKSADPNEINFDHVTYDISARLTNIAQEKFFGSYSLKSLSGEVKASNANTQFNGTAVVGASPPLAISLSQPAGAPLSIGLKNATPVASGPMSDVRVTYQPGSDGPLISIKGRALDASTAYGKSEHSILANFPAIHANLALDNLWLNKDFPLINVQGRLDCNVQRCEAANFSAFAGKGQVRGGITHRAGRREFELTATNAGDFLGALDLSDRVKGGSLSLRGPYDDSAPPPALNAKLEMRDFTLKNSQILGRILTVTSLTGVQNLLTGSGISFNKMLANIRSRGGVITIDKGRANGASIGITVEGTVDTNSTGLKLKGVVVPAYALNSILSNIPIIGDLLGGEGEGIIAFNYGIKGTYENPDVGVNPLSGLTPGFLRGIFGVFDGKQPKVDEGVPVAPAAAPAQKPVAAPANSPTTATKPVTNAAPAKPLHTPPIGVQAPNNNARR